MLPFAVCTFAVNRWWHATSLLFFFAQVAAIFPSALFGIWYLGLSTVERDTYAQFLSRFLPFRRPA
jgi:hypothetical protein